MSEGEAAELLKRYESRRRSAFKVHAEGTPGQFYVFVKLPVRERQAKNGGVFKNKSRILL